MSLQTARDKIEFFYGPPIQVLSDCLRGFLIASPGCRLIACDFSSIEARVLPWLAGEEAVLDVFRGHGLIYEHSASLIYNVPIGQVTKDQRLVGKVSILSLGYQGGVGAASTMARGYQMSLDAAFDSLWERARPDQKERAHAVYNRLKSNPDIQLTKREIYAADLMKQMWRERHPNIVQFWYDLEEAATLALQEPGREFRAGKEPRAIRFKTAGSFLWCRLPSGRCLSYPYPKLREVKTPWGQIKTAVTYMGEMNQKWCRHVAYGGLFAENCTQAVARDLLASALLRVDEAGYPIAAHIHDEIVCDVPNGFGSVDEMAALMCASPEWAAGLPVDADGWEGERYRK